MAEKGDVVRAFVLIEFIYGYAVGVKPVGLSCLNTEPLLPQHFEPLLPQHCESVLPQHHEPLLPQH